MSSGAKKEKSFNGTKAKFSPNAAVPEKKAEVKLRRKESEKVKQASDPNRKSVLGRYVGDYFVYRCTVSLVSVEVHSLLKFLLMQPLCRDINVGPMLLCHNTTSSDSAPKVMLLQDVIKVIKRL